MFRSSPPAKYTDAWVTVFCEVTEGDFCEYRKGNGACEELNVHNVPVNQVQAAGEGAELDAIKLEICKVFESKPEFRTTLLTIARLQAPINHIPLGRMERGMEYRNYGENRNTVEGTK